ncbi:M3 family oligoendopeptidase [Alicyclobacillus mengziensis]|uniref:M3 family oligoendopeptidase n=1 Tax=Alicyclobacillus mengziensis TaxID=2931921 RepID=A0A9X7Z945_9BACL|nr:M3 family oligoendopeptidase [Alicyclobacillus mengziensis]QSO49021.1 M3 family oligoendopeptidase [Alicyclobacillus mengziensis]
MTDTLQQRWNLDTVFPGGSASPQFQDFLDALTADIEQFALDLGTKNASKDVNEWVSMIEKVQNLADRQREAGAFVSCLEAADMKDRGAKALRGRISQQSAQLNSVFTTFDALLTNLPESMFAALLQDERLQTVGFGLEERRRRAKERLHPDQEQLISALMVDGYHGWSQLYDTVVGRMTLSLDREGQQTNLSMGQAHNKLSAPDKAVRDEVFSKWEQAWASEEDIFGDTINHLAGFRLAVYKRRGWDSVLKEPLDINRMDETTLSTMWDVINQNKHHFVDYLKTKARLLRLDKLGWQDVEAPIGSTSRLVPYEEARAFIVSQFREFSPDMAAFADSCFENRWIESEDRPGKRPGGFCTSFPVNEQTRVFTTYSGTIGNVATLAHELGHAYHQHVMRGLPRFAQSYAMNVAETASTFAEMVVADASLRFAKDKDERISLLDDKLRRSVAMFMNIHARFLFETQFYEERKQGLVSVQRLNELMENAQKQAYDGALGSYHPRFWASKLHFYITGTPFYNFPYTFGYLFSTGIYAKARQVGPAFANQYVALLRDTASMRVEDLAAKHLGVNLRGPEFWQEAIDTLLTDVSEFMELTK